MNSNQTYHGSDQTIGLSIVIPAWNEAGLIGDTLDRVNHALRESESNGLVTEIIVCDNDSRDNTAAIAHSAGAIVVSEPIRGIARARNAGARVARGEWLLFLDAGTYPRPELLADVRGLLHERKMVGCGSTMAASGGVWWMHLQVARINVYTLLTGMCGGAFILCRRDAFEAIGGFSDLLHALEEVDFVIRLRSYGFSKGQGFRILRRHPVVTSARRKCSLVTMGISFAVAALFLWLHWLLPRRLRIRGGWGLLEYWYGPRR